MNKKTLDNVKNEIKKASDSISKSQVGIIAKNAEKEIEETINVIVEESEKVIKTATKTAKRKTIKKELFIEYNEIKLSSSEIMKICIEKIEKEFNILDIKNIKFYYKVSENKVYCVVNNDITIDITL